MLSERGDSEDLALPETVQALIAARLDTLSPELKSLLHDASVVGRTFWVGAVATMGGRGRDEVVGGLRELVRREFVRPVRLSSVKGEDEFSIWHALVRDVAYQQIPRAPRAQKHIAAAAWIEETAQERVAEHAEILVHHHEQALELARAAGEERPELQVALARLLLVAGDRAMRLDVGAAEGAYRRALELSLEEGLRAVVLVKLGDALQEQGRLVDAEKAYEDALDALSSAGNQRVAALGMLGLARALWRHGQTTRGRELVLEAIPILEREPDSDLVLAYERAATHDALGGRPNEAIAWAEKGLALARELSIENIVRQLQMRGIARVELGDVGGIDDLREALDLALRLGLGIETATSYLNLGEMIRPFETLAASQELLDTSLEFSRRRGLIHHEMWSRAARLEPLYELGEWDELLREAEDIVHWDRGQGGTQIEAWALRISGPVRAQRGDMEGALRDVAIFLPKAREIGDPQTVGPSLMDAALVAALAGRLDEAVALIGEFERATRGKPYWRAPALPNLARVCVASGELSLLETLLEGATGVAPSRFRLAAQVTARAILAEAHGDVEDAAALYRAAAEDWRKWGSVVERGYALLGLGRCGDVDAGREGKAIFERLGAVPLTAIAA